MRMLVRTAVMLMTGVVTLPAAADNSYYDNAQVLSVSQQSERVNMPRQECRTEYPREVEQSAPRESVAGAIIGGVAGGLLGAQVGRGNGRIAAAAIGAATGAVVGDRMDNRDDAPPPPAERCVIVDNWQTVVRGYLVTYRYGDRIYTATLPRDPGPMLSVRVAVDPVPVNTVGALEADRLSRRERGR